MKTLYYYWRAPFSREGYRRIIWGLGLIVDFLPPVGWLLGVGYRLRFLRLPSTIQEYPAIAPIGPLFSDGVKTACLILIYTSPGFILGLLGFLFSWWLMLPAVLCFSIGLFWMPAAMIRVIQSDTFKEGLNLSAIRHMIKEKRSGYVAAWRVALLSIGVSLLFLPLGYLLFGPATIWAWLVIGEVFEEVFFLE